MTDSGDRREYSDAGHIVDAALGGGSPGKAKYARGLVVVPDDWEPRAGVPRTRGDCPTDRPCPFVRCEWNLWMLDGRDRPGGHRGRIPSVVIAHVQQNCGADIADAVAAGRLAAADVPSAINLSDRHVRRIVERAKQKLAESPEAAENLRDTLDLEQPVDSIMRGKPRK
jgi:hypothetical protein